MRTPTPPRSSPVVLVLALVLAGVWGVTAGGCATRPKAGEEQALIADAAASRQWFERNVSGLTEQIEASSGYASFPGVGQYGLLIGGGKFGRAVVSEPDGSPIGWAYLNAKSAGLQVGAQGFKMLIVFEDPATLARFQEGALTGSVSGVAVAGSGGSSGASSFTEGLAVYQGDGSGLMAGASVGLEYLRYEPIDTPMPEPDPETDPETDS